MKSAPSFSRVLALLLPILLLMCSVWAKPKGEKELPEYKNPYHPQPKMEKLRAKQKLKAFSHMRFAVMGDAKGSSQLPLLFRNIEKNKIDFSITTADLVNSGGGKRGTKDYKKLDEDIGWFLKKYPMWPTVGNHEMSGGDDGIQNFSNFFGVSNDLYRFNYGNAMFIALPWTRLSKGSKRHKWVEGSLKLAKKQKQYVFIYLHRPYYTVGNKSKSDVIGRSNFMTDMFEEYGVIAVFTGHDHTYYRTKRNGVYHIVSAGAGASIYELSRRDEAIEGDVFYGRKQKKDDKEGGSYLFYHADGKKESVGRLSFYVLVEIDKGEIEMTMIDKNGKVWDKFIAVEKPKKFKAPRKDFRGPHYVSYDG
jgi:hypothetical protein